MLRLKLIHVSKRSHRWTLQWGQRLHRGAYHSACGMCLQQLQTGPCWHQEMFECSTIYRWNISPLVEPHIDKHRLMDRAIYVHDEATSHTARLSQDYIHQAAMDENLWHIMSLELDPMKIIWSDMSRKIIAAAVLPRKSSSFASGGQQGLYSISLLKLILDEPLNG